MRTKQLDETKQFIYNKFEKDTTGHDVFHMQRVAKMASYIAKKEHSDVFLAEMAGWLHDVTDAKLTSQPEQAKQELADFLQAIDLEKKQICMITEAIETVSFRKGNVPTSLIGEIVQDADRLDAIGAIGIARAFSYGGNLGRPIYSDNSVQRKISTIQHFYDKLIVIKKGLHTVTAKQIAETRHAFLEQFLEQFFSEWTQLND